MTRFLIKLSFDGTLFNGWQTQPQVRTVQDTLENVLTQIAGQKVMVTGSGRTDAGVHALAQYAHFDLENNMLPENIIPALNSNLPPDVTVLYCWLVNDDFSARYDAISRTYQYHLALQYSPHKRLYSAWLPRFNFSQQALDECLAFFLGEHDFLSFARQNPDLKHYRCNITDFNLIHLNNELVFEITANRFLHNMVRRIVGTCLRISHTKTDPAVITELIAARDPRNNLIYCAPPQGLFLSRVIYRNLPAL
jgi:tRNA pseudouridine38-40 synthase